MKRHIWGALLIGMLYSSVSIAMANTFQLRGFGSLSATYSDSETLGFRRDLTQEGHTDQLRYEPDSVLGLQADMQITDKLKGSLQLVGKDRVNNKFSDSIEWASLSYDFNNTWNIRLGRIGSDLTLIGDVGNISYAYSWVRPPVEFYGFIPFYHYDGLELLYRNSVGDGFLSTRVFYGTSDNTFSYGSSQSDFDLSPFTGVGLRYEKGNLTLRAAYAYTKIKTVENAVVKQLIDGMQPLLPYYPSIAEALQELDSSNTSVHYYTSGFEYRRDSWTWLGEAGFLDSDNSMVLPTFSIYTGLTKRFDMVSLYGLLAHVHSTQNVLQVSSTVPNPYRGYLQAVFNRPDVKQDTLSLGTRWDLYPNVALKGQWDHSWVGADKALLWDCDDATTAAEQVDTFTLSLSFIF